MTVKFTHERLTERHDFAVGFAFRIKIGAAFAAAHRERGQRVFEDLFKTEEFQDAEIHGRMEPETALVRPDRAVELNAVSLIDLNLALVVHPGNLEENDAFRNDHALKNLVLLILAVAVKEFAE